MPSEDQIEVYFPEFDLCTDNGAMIAYAAAMKISRDPSCLTQRDYSMSTHPRWALCSGQ